MCAAAGRGHTRFDFVPPRLRPRGARPGPWPLGAPLHSTPTRLQLALGVPTHPDSTGLWAE